MKKVYIEQAQGLKDLGEILNDLRENNYKIIFVQHVEVYNSWVIGYEIESTTAGAGLPAGKSTT